MEASLVTQQIYFYQHYFLDTTSIYEGDPQAIHSTGDLSFTHCCHVQLQTSAQTSFDLLPLKHSYLFSTQSVNLIQFYISNFQNNILVRNFKMENCNLQQPQILYFATYNLRHILLNFSYCSYKITKSKTQLYLVALILLNSKQLMFTILALNFKLELREMNFFFSSQFVIIFQKLFQLKIPCLIDNIQVIENTFQISNPFQIFPLFQLAVWQLLFKTLQYNTIISNLQP
ncbi:unnamed protein product [Paramecium pentaurelia]|uniref:Transmembrane protein n=1 Tax=Paramecium pentaurelia TaxID=43138 RepID=A0A8S1WPZ6_9CILI|nr:unnamed protein product [Paramecium pentaurelia]